VNKDHDRLFKELLTTFFEEFIELFFPEFHRRIDWKSLTFLTQELFSGKPKRLEVDLLAKVRFLDDAEMFFLIHTEHQAQAQANFKERMFLYFCYLTSDYGLPVLPIAVFSYATPLRAEPNSHQVRLLGQTVVDFQYQVVQLNRLSWRDFVRSKNPIASALMARMRIDIAERPLVKLQCLRLIVSLRLNRKKLRLIIGFVESYLELDGKENLALKREMAKIEPEEAKRVLKLTNQWIEEGKAKGIKLGEKRGEKRGKAEGKAEELRKTVLNMHRMGSSLEFIASVTELPRARVERLIAEAASPSS
jgi:predicted transposase YdaD